MNFENDIAIWKAFKEGNRQAFELIYNREYETLIHYARRFSKDEEIIEDAVHDMFVYLWQKRNNLGDLDKIRPYLMVSLRHKLLNTIKKRSKTEHKEVEEVFFETADSIESDWIRNEAQHEMKNALDSGLQKLSSREREAIHLRYQQSMEYEDICEIMSINYQSVRNLISKGLKKLSEELVQKK